MLRRERKQRFYMKSKKFPKSKLKCFCCGSENHLASRCTIKSSGITCSYCNKPNYLARECFKKKNEENRGKKGTVHHVTDDFLTTTTIITTTITTTTITTTTHAMKKTLIQRCQCL